MTTVDIRIAIIEINIGRRRVAISIVSVSVVVDIDAIADAIAIAIGIAVVVAAVVVCAIVTARWGHQRSIGIKHILGLGRLVIGVFRFVVGGLGVLLHGLQDNHGLVLLAAGVRRVRLVWWIQGGWVVFGSVSGKIQTRFSFLAGGSGSNQTLLFSSFSTTGHALTQLMIYHNIRLTNLK